MIDNWTRDDSDTTSTGVSYFKINFAAGHRRADTVRSQEADTGDPGEARA
jgi:hypothetical protein